MLRGGGGTVHLGGGMLAEIERGRREATLNLFSNVTKEGMGVGVWHPLPPTHTHPL